MTIVVVVMVVVVVVAATLCITAVIATVAVGVPATIAAIVAASAPDLSGLCCGRRKNAGRYSSGRRYDWRSCHRREDLRQRAGRPRHRF